MAVTFHPTAAPIQPIPEAPPAPAGSGVDPVFLVILRNNGGWSPAAKILAVFGSESDAEIFARDMKRSKPFQHIGVAALRSEAREVTAPVEIVHVETEKE